MTDNTAHQGGCLFLQIWPKIKVCSLLQALYVCPNQMTSEDILLICCIRALATFLFFSWVHNLCMVQWWQVSPRGWWDVLGCGIVPHLDGTLIMPGPGEKAPSGPGRCAAEGTDHWLHKSIIPPRVQRQPTGTVDKHAQLYGVAFLDNQNPWM